MKIVVLDAETLGRDISLNEIEALGDCTIYYNTAREELIDRIKDADVAVFNKIKFNEEVLKEAKNLKLICVTATGFDNIDIEYCRKNNIAVSNIVGYSSHSVAQVTCAMVLSLSINMNYFSEYVKSGDYTKSGIANKVTPVYHELFGKTWGIVGYGNIGMEVCAVAKALGCRVVVNKRTPIEGIECVSLEELCKISDIITIHTPLNDLTRGLIDEKMISLMKKDVILVNSARGAVTDEEAICNAILNDKIGAFGTDVYSVEPFGVEHPFTKIMGRDNVCLTPHMAWASYEARCRCISEVAMNIAAFQNGEKRNRVELI